TLGETLAEHHPVTLLLERQLEVNIGRQNGLIGFFCLKGERIVLVEALKQKYPALGAHASDTDHFAGCVDDLVARQQHLAVIAQRIDVYAQKTIEGDFDGSATRCVGFAHDQWNVFDEAVLPLHALGQFVERSDMSPVARLTHDLFGNSARFGRQMVEDGAFVDAVIPDFQVSHFGVATNMFSVRADALTGRVFGFRLVGAQNFGCDGGAGGQTLEIPLPGTDIDFVKIVDRENEIAFGRGIDAKIADVHVPARPRSDAGHGQGRQIACHDRRRPAQEGKWAGEHAAITNRYELLHARGVLPFENFNGIGTIGSAVIMRMRFTRYPFAQCPAGSHSFSDGGTLEHEAVEYRTVFFRPEHPVKGRVDSGL